MDDDIDDDHAVKLLMAIGSARFDSNMLINLSYLAILGDHLWASSTSRSLRFTTELLR
jgi:hypothetical protein